MVYQFHEKGINLIVRLFPLVLKYFFGQMDFIKKVFQGMLSLVYILSDFKAGGGLSPPPPDSGHVP